MPFEQRIARHFGRDGRSHSHQHTRTQDAEGRRPGFPRHRLVILTLGLLNVVLLVAAAVIGIYCAKAKDFQVPESAINPLIAEMIHLRNQSGILRAKTEAEAALAKERASHLRLKIQVREKVAITDVLQKRFLVLYKQKEHLQSNKSVLEENCGKCLPGWQLLKTTCYYFSREERISRKNWNDSRADCIGRGGDLLVINDMEEQKLISDNYVKPVDIGTWWLNGYWMGLTNTGTAGTWVWVNNATEVNSICWRNGQPSLTAPQSGNCAAFFHVTDRLKTWYNANCQQHQLNWICEMEPRT